MRIRNCAGTKSSRSLLSSPIRCSSPWQQGQVLSSISTIDLGPRHVRRHAPRLPRRLRVRACAAQLLRTRNSRPRADRKRGAEAHRRILRDREGNPRPQRVVRQQKSRPLVDAFEAWPRAKLALISQKIKLPEAIRYALSCWQGLTCFIDEGRIEFDNNAVERSIRGIKLSRKNAAVCRIRRWCRTLGCRRALGRDLQDQRRRSARLSHRVLTRIVNSIQTETSTSPALSLPSSSPQSCGLRTTLIEHPTGPPIHRCQHRSRPSAPILAQPGSPGGPHDCSGSIEQRTGRRAEGRATKPLDEAVSCPLPHTGYSIRFSVSGLTRMRLRGVGGR